MDGLTILWTNTAKRQRDSIFEYWNNRNKSNLYSKKLNTLIYERTALLKTFPEMGKWTHFNATRMISMGHYSILYQIKNSKIIITAFWDNRDDPQKLFNLLKNN